MDNTREHAIETIRTLVRQYNLTPQDLARIFGESLQEEKESGGLLQRVMIYIGGAFVFAGLCVYIGIIWDDLDSLSRVVISLGSGFVAFILGLLALGDPRFIKASTPLFLIASALEPAGQFIFMDEYLPHTGDILKASSFVFAFMTLQQGIAFFATGRTSLLFFTVLFFYSFMVSFMRWLGLEAPEAPLALGISGLMATWGIAQTRHVGITPFFYLCSTLITAAACYDIFANTHLDVLLIGVAAALIYLSTHTASKTILTVGVLSLLGYLGYFTDEYFKDIVGWPIALIVMGLFMIGISIFAVKLGRKIAKPAV